MQEISKKSKRRILALVLCMATILGCMPFYSGSAYAADGSITLSHGSRVEYGTHFTTKMYADGSTDNIVYCLEPGKWMPDEGSYQYDLLSKDSAIRKAMYYLKGNTESITVYHEQISREQIKRGDLEFVKISDGDLERLANVPFKITSLTTGENHVIVTDKNGYASTAAKWNQHTENTNAGKTSEDGVWFGEGKPDNSKGALLYDDYEIEELRCDANKGRKLVKIKVSIYKDAVSVPLGTLTNDKIEIGTTAKDGKDNDKLIDSKGEVTIVNTVKYKNLTAGKEYVAKGMLMDKATNKPVKINGKEVTAQTVFTAKESSGSTDVIFTFDINEYEGNDIVVFEKLYDTETDILVANHEDINDEGQSVRVDRPDVPLAPDSPKTGDDNNILLWIILFISAGTAITFVKVRSALKKKHRKAMYKKRIEDSKEFYGEWQ